MTRRDFIVGLGSAVALPLAAQAQQGDRVRRIGVLMAFDANDPVSKSDLSAFTQALAGMGWTDGRNVRMDVRWGGGDTNQARALAQELVGTFRASIASISISIASAEALSRSSRLMITRRISVTCCT